MIDDGFRILVVDDEPNIRSGLAKGLVGEAITIDLAKDGRDALDQFGERGHQLVISDLKLPGDIDGLELVRKIKDSHQDTVVIVITAHGTVETAVEAMRRGAHDFVTKPVDLNMIRHQVRKAAEHHRLVTENKDLRRRLANVGEVPEIVGNSPLMLEVFRQVQQVADTDATVLIQGESGTGKEIIARAIHKLGSRTDSRFVAVNLGALPETLLESELFGYERGAFSGAQRCKPGRFEQANGGTLFLDEVTEMSAKSQIDLLRVLEERQFTRLGGEELLVTDARIIAATNREIVQLVDQEEFREDLYYRLNVVPIIIPPLRERREDIPLLIEHFLQHFCHRHGRNLKTFGADAVRILTDHSWPGNVRQLKNLVERMVVTVASQQVGSDDLPKEIEMRPVPVSDTLASAVEEAEKKAIVSALAECQFHRERTATRLDISVRSLHYKMSRYGLH